MRSTTIIETPRVAVYPKPGSHLERLAFREERRVAWPGDAPEGV
jgi:hypothetical protein